MTWTPTDHDLARWRLRTQALVAPYAATADAVVGGLLAVQAENPAQSAWAVACRTRAPDPTDLADLLDEGRVVRTHVLRPTWHYVRAEDIGWLLELTAPRGAPHHGPAAAHERPRRRGAGGTRRGRARHARPLARPDPRRSSPRRSAAPGTTSAGTS